MSSYELNEAHVIKNETDLRSHFSAVHPLAEKKCLNYLDEHAKSFITRSPFMCLGTQGVDGKADVSPRGDPNGFVQILDDKTIAIPDRPGNNRLDSLANIVDNPNVGLLFLVPGFDDTLRINGKATLTTDPDLLAKMSIRDRAPKLAIVVKVEETFLHCAKAFRRSKLWDPSSFQNRDELPSIAQIILEQTDGAPQDKQEMAQIDKDLEQQYRETMY